MHQLMARPETSLHGEVDSLETWLHPNDETGTAPSGAAGQLTTTGLSRQVKARDLHPGDILQQCDWSLHVREVQIGEPVVAVAVTEFGFALHYADDEMLRVAV